MVGKLKKSPEQSRKSVKNEDFFSSKNSISFSLV